MNLFTGYIVFHDNHIGFLELDQKLKYLPSKLSKGKRMNGINRLISNGNHLESVSCCC